MILFMNQHLFMFLSSINSHDYKSAFGVDVNVCLSKADRLIYGESLMTHAMTFTAVTLDVSIKMLSSLLSGNVKEEKVK